MLAAARPGRPRGRQRRAAFRATAQAQADALFGAASPAASAFAADLDIWLADMDTSLEASAGAPPKPA